MEWVESTGRSIEDAKEAALDRLGVHEDDAEFDVLTEAKTGLFGRVKEDARVRARVRPTAPRTKDDRRRGRGRSRNRKGSGEGRGGGRSSGHDDRDRDGRSNGGRSGQRKSGGEGSRSGGRSSQRSGSKDRAGQRQASRAGDEPDKGNGKGRGSSTDGASGRDDRKREKVMTDDNGPSLEEQATIAEEFVAGLAERFGTPVQFARDDVSDGILRIEASGDDIGALIGPRGATAQAVDELVRTVLQRAGGTTREGKIRVDIGGVRARRAEALARFTRQMAEKVLEEGEDVVLEPMGGADRKVVHDTIGEIDGVETRSEGEEPNRRVVIVPGSEA